MRGTTIIRLVCCWCMLQLIPLIFAEDNAEIKRLLSEGDKLLLKGRSSYQDAVSKYSQAVSMDSKNVKALYRRADLYFMMKETERAMTDLGKVLQLDPDNRAGLVLRAKHSSAAGDLLGAAADYERAARIFQKQKDMKKSNDMAVKAQNARELGTKLEYIFNGLKANPDMDQRMHLNQQCVELLREVIVHFAKDNVKMRLKRAECALAARNQMAASDEVKVILTREPQNLKAIAINAQSLRSLGAIEAAKSEVKRCLTLDPEFSPCAKLHKAIKAYQKQLTLIQQHKDNKKWVLAVEEIEKALSMEENPPNLDELWRWKCEAYVNEKDIQKGFEACKTTLSVFQSSDGNMRSNPQVVDIYLNLADLHIMDDDINGAESEVNKAAEAHGNDNHERIKEYRQKLERLKQQAARKDYYKILGVKKTAGDSQIRRAYRKLARDLHPDRLRSMHISEAERDKARRKFEDVKEAKEILLDDEKRKRYDAGEDPTKPPEQQQQGFHFPGGGFPGGFPGGGGNFHFHFG